MHQPEDQACDRDPGGNDCAPEDKELPEGAHVLERQMLRDHGAQLFRGNLICAEWNRLHGLPRDGSAQGAKEGVKSP
jgi:hypothetical protein